MTLTSTSLTDGQPCPAEFAFCIPDSGGDAPVTLGVNRSPHVEWADFPASTRSFALVMVDPDAPAYRDGAGEAGKTVEYDRERADFFHWLLVDIPAGRTSLHEGHDSDGVTPGGKDARPTPYGTRGANSYTQWFEGDADMAGTYGGYDGPCPPWNDERTHRYRLTVYALDTESLDLPDAFDGNQAMEAIQKHALESATLTVTYSLNPNARPAPTE